MKIPSFVFHNDVLPCYTSLKWSTFQFMTMEMFFISNVKLMDTRCFLLHLKSSQCENEVTQKPVIISNPFLIAFRVKHLSQCFFNSWKHVIIFYLCVQSLSAVIPGFLPQWCLFSLFSHIFSFTKLNTHSLSSTTPVILTFFHKSNKISSIKTHIGCISRTVMDTDLH